MNIITGIVERRSWGVTKVLLKAHMCDLGLQIGRSAQCLTVVLEALGQALNCSISCYRRDSALFSLYVPLHRPVLPLGTQVPARGAAFFFPFSKGRTKLQTPRQIRAGICLSRSFFILIAQEDPFAAAHIY